MIAPRAGDRRCTSLVSCREEAVAAQFKMLPDSIDLAGEWTLLSEDGLISSPYPVPGDIHSALIAGGHIPQPHRGRNELDVRWVANQNWTATRTFHFEGSTGARQYLDIDYLDTVAVITLNGTDVLHAENCFRRYRPDVTEHLVEGENTIEICFKSNTKAANAKQDALPFPIPHHAGNSPIPNGNMLRKPACHWGWDWNLAIVPFGLYGSIRLCSLSNFRIEHFTVRQIHGAPGEPVTVDVDVVLHGRGSSEMLVSFGEETKTRQIDHSFGEAKQRFRFKVDDPKLWWPTGYGEQHLYDVSVAVDGQTLSRRVGLRDIKLITDPDETGRRFLFRVNGQEIFCKGANWVPADALPSAITPDGARKLLQAAKDAHMNMIRVWGGGYYEPDYFYDMCDELGLLVWQDFMFACNLYPSTTEFLKQVKSEVDYQVRRLQHHACVALWCGDNELVGALNWFEESRKDRDRYLVNYDRLNRTIEDAMRAADPAANWWPSSPSAGVLNFGDAWHDDSQGDMHMWSVWHEGRNFEHYRDIKPRFCSEFGFQSFPSMRVIREFIERDDDLNVSAAVMEHHQRNAGGNARIAETMFRYFRFPSNFENFVYLSQVQQGFAIRTAVESWRSLKPHCMGTLYWQLNDTWPVASWSSLDHGGGWKALHYLAKRFYSPFMVTCQREADNGDIVFHAVNDLAEIVDFKFAARFVPTLGSPDPSLSTSVNGLGPDALEIFRIRASDVKTGGVYIYAWELASGVKGRNHFAPVAYKAIDFVHPELTVDAAQADGVAHLRIRTEKLSLYVGIDCAVPGSFSDNFFDLLPGESRTITFIPDNPSELESAIKSMKVRDLYSASRSRKIQSPGDAST
jgi:beta-mannosidase